MAALKTYLGDTACLCCGRPTPVQRNPQGTISMHCVACKWSGYAPGESKAGAELLGRVGGKTDPAPARKADPAPKPTPPARRAPEPFSLGQL